MMVEQTSISVITASWYWLWIESIHSYVAFDIFLYDVEAAYNGLPCPPYDLQKELTCAVCTKWYTWTLANMFYE